MTGDLEHYQEMFRSEVGVARRATQDSMFWREIASRQADEIAELRARAYPSMVRRVAKPLILRWHMRRMFRGAPLG